MTQEQIEARIELSRRHLTHFTEVTFPNYHRTKMHDIYSGVLNRFAHGDVKKLIISLPPQHGKSELSSRRLPAYMLGLDPDLQLAIASYSQTFARKFGREVRRIMSEPKYKYIFPRTRLAGAIDRGYTNSADVSEVVNHAGSLILAGRGAGLTGMPVDVLIMDDMYKNAEEANSPVIRDSVIEWYKTVAETRLHNDSQQLIVFTRWHQEDLVGWLESQGLVDDLIDRAQLDNSPSDRWLKLNLPAIKEAEPYDLDPRKPGQALWPERHSVKRLLAKKAQDEEVFGSLYQGDPKPSKGLLYEGGFNEYDYLPETIVSRVAYADTADQGSDYLCLICAVKSKEGELYLTDVLYTQEGQEITEPMGAKMLLDNTVEDAWIESNAGGRTYARNIQRLVEESKGRTAIRWFSQTKNKEARILTNSASVKQHVYMPRGWRKKWPEFARGLLEFRKNFRANTHDDAPDGLTGLWEKTQSNVSIVI